MLTTLFEAAVRGGALLAVVWAVLKVLRLRDPAVEKNIWTLIAAAALAMPILSWVASIAASPLKLLSLQMLPSGPVATAAALTGVALVPSGPHSVTVYALAYMVVTAVLLARIVTGLWIGAQLRRTASRIPGLSGDSADIRVSAAIRTPASFASTILLPPGYETWDNATFAAVLEHEQAHVRNRDCYRLWLAAVYRAVFWFDPLAHWLHRRLRDLSEQTSDEAAAAGERVAYAATLKQMASPARFIPSTIAMADSRTLGRRLRRLLSEQGACAPLARPWRVLLMSAVLVMIALAAVTRTGATVPAAQRPATLEFHLVDEQNSAVQAQHGGEVPPGDMLYAMKNGTPILLKRQVIAAGDELTQAIVRTTPEGPVVDVRLDARGAASMLTTTRDNLGHRMAAVYDGRVINAAVIRGIFGQQFQVSGLATAEAQALAMQFNRQLQK